MALVAGHDLPTEAKLHVFNECGDLARYAYAFMHRGGMEFTLPRYRIFMYGTTIHGTIFRTPPPPGPHQPVFIM